VTEIACEDRPVTTVPAHGTLAPVWRATASSLPPSRWISDTWELNDRNLNWARDEVAEWLRLKGPAAVFAPFFIDQLAHHYLRAFELFAGRRFNLSVFSIFDAVGEIEAPPRGKRTRAHSRFSRHPCPELEGLWHKHFFDAQFLIQNLQQELESEFDTLWYRDFQKLRMDAGLQNESSVQKLSGLITDAMVFGAHRNRAGTAGQRRIDSRMTGEWLVFAETEWVMFT
jgi:hypothetical protein